MNLGTRSRAYAGVGSRETPLPIQDLMKRLAFALCQDHWTLRSGGAQGADNAFYEGFCQAPYNPNGRAEIYLPWDKFNGFRLDGNVFLSPSANVIQALELAKSYHPNWGALSAAGRALMARNSYQILGRGLDHPVQFVICWTPGASGSGGTGQAIRMARDFSIPVYDLGDDATRKWAEDELRTLIAQI